MYRIINLRDWVPIGEPYTSEREAHASMHDLLVSGEIGVGSGWYIVVFSAEDSE